MKYTYGKKLKSFKDKLISGFAGLVLLANSMGMAVPFMFAPKVAAAAPALTNVDAYYASGSGYTGVGIDFTLSEATTVTDVELLVHRDSGDPVSIHGTSDLFGAINSSVTDTYTTTGTVIVTGSRTSSSGSWETMAGTWTGSSRPTSAEVRVTLLGGTILSLVDSTIVDNGGNTQATVFATVPEITNVSAEYVEHSSPDYTGVWVDFKEKNITTATSVELRLNREDGTHYSINALTPVLTAVNAGTAEYETGGTVIITGGRTSSSWTPQVSTWTGSSRLAATDPVEVLITLANGNVLSKTLPLESSIRNQAIEDAVFPAEPSLSFVANYIDNAQYGGISLEIVTPDLTDGTGVEITVDRTNGAPDTWSNKPAGTVMPALNGGSHTVTAPIVIAEKTRTRTSSSSWQTTGEPWTSDQEPTSVTVRVTRAGGPTLEQTVSLIGSPWGATWPQIAAQLPTPDTTAPIAIIDTPADNSLFNGGVLSVTGHVSDDIGMSHYSMYLYNGTVDLSDGEVHSSSRITTPGGWTAGGQTNVAGLLHHDVSRTLDLSLLDDGEYQIRLAVRDLAGNRNATDSVDVVRFTVDKTAPEVSGVVLNGEAVTVARDVNCGPTDFNVVGSTVNLSATITDNLSGVKKAVYKIRKVTNGGCTQTAIYQSSTVNMSNSVADEWVTLPGSELDTSGIPDGNYTIQMTVTDNADNTVTKYVDITVDNTAPSAPTITAPGTRTWHKTAPIVNSWSAATDDNGVASYQIAYNYDNGHYFGGSTCPGVTMTGYGGFIGCRDVNGLSRNHGPNPTEEGGVTIWVRAIDNAGNVGLWSRPVHYYYDHTTPVTNIVAPTGVVGNNFTISGDAVDNLALNRVYVQLNKNTGGRFGGTTIHLITNPFSTTSSWSKTYDAAALGLADGEYRAHVSVTDMAGNSSTAGWTDYFTVDTTAPVVTVNDIAPVEEGENSQVTGTVDDPSVTSVEVFVNGVSRGFATVTGGNFSFDITGLGVGDHDVEVRAGDGTGNTGTSAVKVASVTAVTPLVPNDDEEEDQEVAGATDDSDDDDVTIVDNNGQVAAAFTDESNAEEDASVLQASDSASDANGGDLENDTVQEEGCTKWFGICWYYWIPVVAAILVAIYYLSRRRSNKE